MDSRIDLKSILNAKLLLISKLVLSQVTTMVKSKIQKCYTIRGLNWRFKFEALNFKPWLRIRLGCWLINDLMLKIWNLDY